jgi:hypothetical protein
MKSILLALIACISFSGAAQGAQSTKGENPYNWIVDNIRGIPGARVHVMRGILRYGFEHSVLLRDSSQKRSIVWVDFDEDVLRADRDFWKSWSDFKKITEKAITSPKQTFYYEITAEVEVRPFPLVEMRNGELFEIGYGHMGSCPIGIVVKRIYTITEINKNGAQPAATDNDPQLPVFE